MLPEGTIEATHLWKRFRADRHGALIKDQIRRLRARLRGRDPGWTWALRDVDFSVGPGETLGIVGPNGSGKTTLLRLLSGVMYPYAGQVSVSGRVGALIEVRAGIHPELTGRENVFVYGTLLGLSRKAVARRFDEIVAFAELTDAIDRQVKHYSSGMQMRLGFAVAAFLDPAILIVDEILAVGDAAFQQRCLERMREVVRQGTTLLFVSHDLATVEATCATTIWLNRGIQASQGPTAEVLAQYRQSVEEFAEVPKRHGGPVELLEIDVSAGDGEWPRTQGPVDVRLVLKKNQDARDGGPTQVHIGVTEGPATPIFVLRHILQLGNDPTALVCRIPRLPLPQGRYYVWVSVSQPREDGIPWHPAARFEVIGEKLDKAPRSIVRLAPVHVESEWQVSTGDGLDRLSSGLAPGEIPAGR